MEIHEFLRSHRLRCGYSTYSAMASKAKKLGHNTSPQALNKAERVLQYITPATRAMYVDVLKLSDTEADALDVLAARCQIRKGSNTNPYMTVCDTRVYQSAVTTSTDMVLRLVNDIIGRKSSLSTVDEELLRAALQGVLCRPLYHISPESS